MVRRNDHILPVHEIPLNKSSFESLKQTLTFWTREQTTYTYSIVHTLSSRVDKCHLTTDKSNLSN